MNGASGIGRFRTDCTVLLTLLGLLVALCWAYLLFHAGRMAPVDTGSGSALHAAPYRLPEPGLLYAPWVAVTAALMLPAAVPSVLFYARVKRARRALGLPARPAVHPGLPVRLVRRRGGRRPGRLAAARRRRARRDDGGMAPGARSAWA